MKMRIAAFVGKIRQYHFELKHLIVLFAILIAFQALISLVHKFSLQGFLFKTQEWYQRDSAERLANLTATSLELLLETSLHYRSVSDEDARRIVQAFNIILSQQILQQNVQEVCLLVSVGKDIAAIDNGEVLYSYLFKGDGRLPPPETPHPQAIAKYKALQDRIRATEQIHSMLEGKQTFHVFVPFVPKGEYLGAVYMKNTPDFGFITRQIAMSYNESSLIFTGLILFGLLAMFHISSNTVKERDQAQSQLFFEREKQLEERIHFQKESLFTKRIYHTHHKAEKVMGFIKEDLRRLACDNLEEIKNRVNRYANFISRVIYDMKWFDPPLQTIRNPMFRTDLNEVIRFVVQHVFLRVSNSAPVCKIHLDLDEQLPSVPINEYVVWEILEPLLQNSLEHNSDREIVLSVATRHLPAANCSLIRVADSGSGIDPALLERDGRGIKKIFLESVSTKNNEQHSGYGCYLAHEIATQRCGWQIDAENLPESGCQFSITIPATAA